MEMDVKRVKCRTLRVQRTTWTNSHWNTMAEFLLAEHKQEKLERPSIMECLRRLRDRKDFDNFSDSQLKGGYHNFKKKYLEVKKWCNDTRNGLKDKDPDTIEALIREKWEFYPIADEIFGTRQSMNPSYVHESGVQMAAVGSTYQVLWDDDWKVTDAADSGYVPDDVQSNVEEDEEEENETSVSNDASEVSPNVLTPNYLDNRTSALRIKHTTPKCGAEVLCSAQDRRTSVAVRKLELEEKKWEMQLQLDEQTTRQQLRIEEERIAYKRLRLDKKFDDKERTRRFKAEEKEKDRQFEREKMEHSLEMLKFQVELAKLQKKD